MVSYFTFFSRYSILYHSFGLLRCNRLYVRIHGHTWFIFSFAAFAGFFFFSRFRLNIREHTIAVEVKRMQRICKLDERACEATPVKTIWNLYLNASENQITRTANAINSGNGTSASLYIQVWMCIRVKWQWEWMGNDIYACIRTFGKKDGNNQDRELAMRMKPRSKRSFAYQAEGSWRIFQYYMIFKCKYLSAAGIAFDWRKNNWIRCAFFSINVWIKRAF